MKQLINKIDNYKSLLELCLWTTNETLDICKLNKDNYHDLDTVLKLGKDFLENKKINLGSLFRDKQLEERQLYYRQQTLFSRYIDITLVKSDNVTIFTNDFDIFIDKFIEWEMVSSASQILILISKIKQKRKYKKEEPFFLYHGTVNKTHREKLINKINSLGKNGTNRYA